MSEQAETPTTASSAPARRPCGRALAAIRAAEQAARPFGARVLVFGSLANGKFGPWSDTDLGVTAPSDRARDAMLDVALAVEAHGFECDVIDMARASPGLRERIERDGRETGALG